MNGVAVSQALRERPLETLLVEPFPDSFNALGYFTARDASLQLEAHPDEVAAHAAVLSNYVFARDPGTLDLATAMTHRYEQARDFMQQHPDGQEQLAEQVLARIQAMHICMSEGYVPAPTNTIMSSDHARPRSQVSDIGMAQRLNLPPVIQARALAWNKWAQAEITAGRIDELFTDEISRHGVKAAIGALLPAGNLWVEVAEGIERIRDNLHSGLQLETKWGLQTDQQQSWGAGLDDWFVLSHIAEKGLLKLATSIGPDMIDGMQLTDDVYIRSYAPIIELIDLNPQLNIKGILSDGSWIYSQELGQVFPDQHVARLHDIAGSVVELGSAEAIGLPIQAMFATLDPRRRAAYETGEYQAGVAARFIDREGMAAILQRFGIAPPADIVS